MGETKKFVLRLVLLKVWYAVIVFIQHDIIQYIDHNIYSYKRILLDEIDRLTPKDYLNEVDHE